jgi:hypothetical protein
MWLESGAVAVGWPIVTDNRGFRERPKREPYLVSTALVGIELRAWLYHRTRDEDASRAALAALEYTLSTIKPDGFQEKVGRKKAPAHRGLRRGGLDGGRPAARRSARAGPVAPGPAATRGLALAHPAPDGTWDDGESGSWARTPAIVDFLIWYEHALRVDAGGARGDSQSGPCARGLSIAGRRARFWRGDHHEVLRAILGRPLAALASGKSVM